MTLAITIAAIAQWGYLLEPAAREAGVDPRILASIIYVESRGWPTTISDCGAVGLCGVIPYGRQTVADLLPPEANIPEGAARFRVALDYVGGDVRLGLVAYHLGIAGAERAGWLRSEAGAEYVRRIAEAWRLLFPGVPLPWATVRPVGTGEQEE